MAQLGQDELGHGALGPGVTAKDLALEVIRRLGVHGGSGFAYEYGGEVVDRLSMEKWKKLGLMPSSPADDATFLRRVTIDIAGTLDDEAQPGLTADALRRIEAPAFAKRTSIRPWRRFTAA